MRPVLLLILTAAIAAAENPGTALNGWGKITWGMTVADARAAIGPEASDPTGTPGAAVVLIPRLLITHFSIGTLEARAAIQSARGSESVSAVTLTFGEVNAPTFTRSTAFSELKQLLIEKYGSPRDEQSKPTGSGNTAHIAFWSFPQTTITLTWSEAPANYSIGSVTLRYQAVDRRALDVL